MLNVLVDLTGSWATSPASLGRGHVPPPDELFLAAQMEDETVRLEERLAGRLRRPHGPSSARCTGRPPTPTWRAPRPRRSPRPCAATGPPAARVLLRLQGSGTWIRNEPGNSADECEGR